MSKSKKHNHQAPRKDSKRTWFFALLLITITTIAYIKSIHYPYAFDSKHLLYKSFFDSAWNFSIFSTRWVTNLSFAFVQNLFPASIAAQRLTNILIHSANTCLLFILIKNLFTRRPHPDAPIPIFYPFFAALIFAINPVAVYATAYTIQRYILLATFFSLLSLIIYFKGLTQKKFSFYLFSVLFYYLAIHSKEHAIMLPAAALALTVAVRKFDKELIKELSIPFFLFAIIGIQIILTMKGIIGTVYEPHGQMALDPSVTSTATDDFQHTHPLVLSIITQGWLFFKYIFLWFVPYLKWLSIDVQFSKITSFFAWPETFGFIFFCLYPILFTRLLFNRGWKGMMAFGALFTWILFATELVLVRFSEQFVLYRSYLWIVGFFVVVPLCLKKIPRKILSPLFLLYVAFLVIVMQNRLYTFHSMVSVWQDAVNKIDPADKDIITSYRAFNSLGFALLEDKQNEKALEALQTAVIHKPNYEIALYNLGVAQEAMNLRNEAIKSYTLAITYKPDYPRAHNNLGSLLVKENRHEEAIPHFQNALKYDPKFVSAINNLGAAYVALDRLKEGIAQYKLALKIDPGFAGAHNNLAIAYARQGEDDQAILSYQKAIEIDPNYLEAALNLGDLYYRTGEYEKAIHQYNLVLNKNPKSNSAYYSKGNALVRLNRMNVAIDAYNSALKVDPSSAKTWYNLGAALAHQNRKDEAVMAYKKALELDPHNEQIRKTLNSLTPLTPAN